MPPGNSLDTYSKDTYSVDSTYSQAGVFCLLVRLGFVFVLRRPRPSHRVIGAGTQINVEIVHVAGDIWIIAECRHDVFLRRADVLPTAGDHSEEVTVVHGLERILQRGG